MKKHINIRRLLQAAAFSLFLALLLPLGAEAKVYIDIDAPAGDRLPIAVQELSLQPRQAKDKSMTDYSGKAIMDALMGDLAFTGYFDIIDKEAHLKTRFSLQKTKFPRWRAIGADLLVKGLIKVSGDELTVELRLYDTVRERQVTGTRYIGRVLNPRLIAHKFADEIMEELTGQRGIFSTRILFTADKEGLGNKEVFISDYDGKNIRQLTYNGAINLSPRWSPDGKKIIYTSYKDGWPCIYMRDLISGREERISAKPGLNIGGRWSPDGKKIALTLSINKNPELYILDLGSRTYKRLTNNHGIDVSPTWSPDGEKLAYVSDIAGNPHIYAINSHGGVPTRYTYKGKYNTTPSWSPSGDMIAFSRIKNGKFQIYVMRSDGTGERQLTYNGSNEDPSWSPDSKHIIFSSTRQSDSKNSSLYVVRPDGSGLRKLDIGFTHEASPMWSPYL